MAKNQFKTQSTDEVDTVETQDEVNTEIETSDIPAGESSEPVVNTDDTDIPVDEAPVEPVVEAPVVGYENKLVIKPRASSLYAEPKGHIIRPGEPVTVVGTEDGEFTLLTENVYRESYSRNTANPSFTLVYPKGKRISKHIAPRFIPAE